MKFDDFLRWCFHRTAYFDGGGTAMNLMAQRRAESKQRWLDKEFTPFDQGCREKFFLAATSFLYSNFSAELSNGAYYEFGCHKGRTMRHCWRHTQHNFTLSYYAFDSFEGLPEPTSEDAHVGWKKGEFAVSEEDFRAVVEGAGMPKHRLFTFKGFYADTLPKIQVFADRKNSGTFHTTMPGDTRTLRDATIVYIDCDLYSSAAEALKFIGPRLQKGTLIAFDDWNCYLADPDKGERKAWREFTAANTRMKFEPFYSTHMMQAFVTVAV